jgi:hypothetical protein
VDRYGKLLKFAAFNQIARVKKTGPEKRGRWRKRSISNHVVFSDTILIWTTAPPRTKEFTTWPDFFFPMLCSLFGEALRMDLPLRIGVAFGECTIAKGIYGEHAGRPARSRRWKSTAMKE